MSLELCAECGESLQGSGEGFIDVRYCDDCYDEIKELAGESDHEEIEEHRVKLSQFDLDHLNAGQPVFKGVRSDIRLVLYSDAPLEDGDSDD